MLGRFNVLYATRTLTHYTMSAAAGSFTLSGQAAALKKGYLLAAGAGTFTLSGVAAGVRADRGMNAGAGAFTLTGGGKIPAENRRRSRP